MSNIIVTPARAEELRPAASILAEAFEHDPVLGVIVPQRDRRRERLTDLFEATLNAGPYTTGTVDLARSSDGELLGVAAWEGPEARRGALGRLARRLPLFVRSMGWMRLAGAFAMLSRMERYRPTAPHWYLAEIGVSSRARGRGVGATLLSTHLRALDTMRQNAYLESSTPDNRRLYRRLGFEELAPITGLPGARPVAMLRRPVG
ncbi:GNAT family N-acetyltransferase [Microbacterium sp. RG1]|uniref:GNAT family N-acetyltransferase n=1 Tax=Microbacterium sp. RG1 TaxID=2489212 RepID=UPI0010CA5F1B|nr:GNAT family N-acetyltransferase [Microbacterium sp. RG1]QCQ16969.1 GNAT family N-acetyltransferase [Microbacterium sp. RG1]